MVESSARQKELVVRGVEWGTDRVSASLTLDGAEHRLRFVASEGFGRRMDFLVPALLMPAMRAGVDLELSGEVSPGLLSAVPKIQDVLNLWDERFRRVRVSAPPSDVAPEQRASGVACFFSGGVDSFYTLLQRREEITHLIFMELPLGSPFVQAQASRAAHEVAEELGKTLIEVKTNCHPFGKATSVPWSYYHGARMAGVGLLFQHKFSKILIPSTFDYASLFPWGSHPLLDPLWSADLMEFEHHGCGATRAEKTASISTNPTAMEWLRVCYKDPNAYNCGHCEKCLRTMIGLRVAGALERCRTLPGKLDLEAVADMNLAGEVAETFARQNLKALEHRENEAELATVLAEALCRSQQTPREKAQRAQQEKLQKRLERTRMKLEEARDAVRRLRTKNKKLRARLGAARKRPEALKGCSGDS